VVFAGKAKRSIQKLTSADRERLKERILQLAEDPRGAGKPLMGAFKARGIWSARVGDYRVLYAILEEEKTILVVKVDLRKKVYHG
jgi:mRNA interferase RelE/StbE